MADELQTTPQNTEIAALPDFAAGAAYVDQTMFDEMAKSNYMARLQICGGNSNLVMEGKIGVGKLAFVRSKDDIVDFGDTIDVIPLSMRFAALRFGSGDEKTQVYYNPHSEEFKQIQVDSQEQDSGCSYGPQFLIWIPAVNDYATFLFGSKSARPEARKLHPLMNKGATIKPKLVTNNKNKWFVPVVVPCTRPLDVPDVERTRAIAEKFNKPDDVETIDEGANQAATAAAAGSDDRVR